MIKRGVKKGFTLIELTLSIAFVGMLSLMIVLIINNTVEAYQRGMTLNKINTTGMDLVDDMRFAVQNSSMKSVVNNCEIYNNTAGNYAVRQQCQNDNAYSFVYVNKVISLDVGSGYKNVPIYGAFCSGTYSYIWNSGYFWSDNQNLGGQLNNKGPAKFVYRGADGSVKTKDNFRLLKVRDDSRAVCTSSAGWFGQSSTDKYSANPDLSANFNISSGPQVTEEPVDLILDDKTKGNNNDLAIYDLYVARPAESISNENTFYSVSFILGTLRGGIDITAKGRNCIPPNDTNGEYFNYCAINKFNFAAQASGE